MGVEQFTMVVKTHKLITISKLKKVRENSVCTKVDQCPLSVFLISYKNRKSPLYAAYWGMYSDFLLRLYLLGKNGQDM